MYTTVTQYSFSASPRFEWWQGNGVGRRQVAPYDSFSILRPSGAAPAPGTTADMGGTRGVGVGSVLASTFHNVGGVLPGN